ncbi:hypothetical protein HW49_09245 [Porphyromonadaceae bacterium COT-184 OH4590]|nr:hypothetical protein HW49_09245 [Porphyromonadaceae bacterium COT-184 OH4590]
MTTYQSKTTTINRPQTEVYTKISDLKNLEQFREKLPEEYSDDFRCDTDYLKFKIPQIGNATLRVVEREANRVKLSIEDIPFKADIAIVINEKATSQTDMMLQLDADIPFFLKHIVSNKLNEGIDKIADMLAQSLNSL